MKIQSLAIIFVIIILPISMVLSEYVDNLITSQETEIEYDTKLLNSTYDAIKAYQLNTVNNAFGDVTTEKVNDIEAAAKTFFNSLSSNFGYIGYQSDLMQEYVPAVVFTMYDGYYIYSPFKNTLTEVSDEEVNKGYDERYSVNGELRNGLKPYVYYNCRYKIGDDSDFVITYTLANYITIQGIINGEYTYDYGYIYSIASSESDADAGKGIYEGIESGEKYYVYNGVKFTENDTEELKEYVGNTEYSYVKINGKKYYLDDPVEKNYSHNVSDSKGNSINENAKIFYIDEKGEKNYNQTKGYNLSNTVEENQEFLKYYNAIKYNKSAYEYLKNAYEFSKVCLTNNSTTISDYKNKAGKQIQRGYGLTRLSTNDIQVDVNENLSNDITNIEEYGEFDIFSGDNIGQEGSNFEKHRKAVIRYVVETNLTTAIASFASSAKTTFIMPKISEPNWDIIENDVCAISFMQGMSIGSKKYNGYAVVANTLTKEYVDENDIYILAKSDSNNSKVYCRANDNGLTDGTYSIIEKNAERKKLLFWTMENRF